MKVFKGFTLIEVMAALAIMAVGLSATMTAVSSFALQSEKLQNRSHAQWLIANRLAQHQLKAHANTLANLSSSSVTQTMGGRDWFLRETVSDAFNRHGKKIKIKVCMDQNYDQCVIEETVFVALNKFELR